MNIFYRKNNYILNIFFFYLFKKKFLGNKKLSGTLKNFTYHKYNENIYFFLKKYYFYKQFISYNLIKSNIHTIFNKIKYFFDILLLNKFKHYSSKIPFFLKKLTFLSFTFNKNVNFFKKIAYNIKIIFNFFYSSIFTKIIMYLLFRNKNCTFSIPRKSSVITILRSPFIDKKSREQFSITNNKFVFQDTSIFGIIINSNVFELFTYFITNMKYEEKVEYLCI